MIITVYGSDDGGQTAHADDPQFCALMKEAAKWISIKGHIVGTFMKQKLYA